MNIENLQGQFPTRPSPESQAEHKRGSRCGTVHFVAYDRVDLEPSLWLELVIVLIRPDARERRFRHLSRSRAAFFVVEWQSQLQVARAVRHQETLVPLGCADPELRYLGEPDGP